MKVKSGGTCVTLPTKGVSAKATLTDTPGGVTLTPVSVEVRLQRAWYVFLESLLGKKLPERVRCEGDDGGGSALKILNSKNGPWMTLKRQGKGTLVLCIWPRDGDPPRDIPGVLFLKKGDLAGIDLAASASDARRVQEVANAIANADVVFKTTELQDLARASDNPIVRALLRRAHGSVATLSPYGLNAASWARFYTAPETKKASASSSSSSSSSSASGEPSFVVGDDSVTSGSPTGSEEEVISVDSEGDSEDSSEEVRGGGIQEKVPEIVPDIGAITWFCLGVAAASFASRQDAQDAPPPKRQRLE